jgi:hypothetical protein
MIVIVIVIAAMMVTTMVMVAVIAGTVAIAAGQRDCGQRKRAGELQDTHMLSPCLGQRMTFAPVPLNLH